MLEDDAVKLRHNDAWRCYKP